MEPRLLDYIG